MPTVELDKKTIKEKIGKETTDKELKEKIPMMGTDLEEITEDKIKVEIFPNRPDMLSEQGFARALSSFLGKNTGLKKYNIQESNKKIKIKNDVKNVRPYTACAIIKDLKLDSEKIREIIQIQEKLHLTHGRNRKRAAIGIYPLKNIEFPITFTAEPPEQIKFQPLNHSEELKADEILEKHSAGKYGHLLENKDKYPIFKDNNDNILSMPPIINSQKIGKIESGIENLFIECSGFNQRILNITLSILTTTLSDMGGKVKTITIEDTDSTYQTPDLTPEKIPIDKEYINQRTGLNKKLEEIKKLLKKMGYGIEENKALIPPWRADIMHKIDLAEDVAISHGYDNIQGENPNISTIGKETTNQKIKEQIRNILTNTEYQEVKNFHLISEEKINKTGLKTENSTQLLNALGENNYLRPSLIPNILEVFNKNKHQKHPQKIFEIGTIFNKEGEEKQKITIGKCGNQTDYTTIKQIINLIQKLLDINTEIEETNTSWSINGRTAKIKHNNNTIGVFGEVHPKILDNWEIKTPVVISELSLEEIKKQLQKQLQN